MWRKLHTAIIRISANHVPASSCQTHLSSPGSAHTVPVKFDASHKSAGFFFLAPWSQLQPTLACCSTSLSKWSNLRVPFYWHVCKKKTLIGNLVVFSVASSDAGIGHQSSIKKSVSSCTFVLPIIYLFISFWGVWRMSLIPDGGTCYRHISFAKW
jgi:hypothetical protein